MCVRGIYPPLEPRAGGRWRLPSPPYPAQLTLVRGPLRIREGLQLDPVVAGLDAPLVDAAVRGAQIEPRRIEPDLHLGDRAVERVVLAARRVRVAPGDGLPLGGTRLHDDARELDAAPRGSGPHAGRARAAEPAALAACVDRAVRDPGRQDGADAHAPDRQVQPRVR